MIDSQMAEQESVSHRVHSTRELETMAAFSDIPPTAGSFNPAQTLTLPDSEFTGNERHDAVQDPQRTEGGHVLEKKMEEIRAPPRSDVKHEGVRCRGGPIDLALFDR